MTQKKPVIDLDAAPELTADFFRQALYRENMHPVACGPDAPAAFKALVDKHKGEPVPDCDFVEASRSKADGETSVLITRVPRKKANGRGRIISHNPTPETAAAIARMDAGQFETIGTEAELADWFRRAGLANS